MSDHERKVLLDAQAVALRMIHAGEHKARDAYEGLKRLFEQLELEEKRDSRELTAPF